MANIYEFIKEIDLSIASYKGKLTQGYVDGKNLLMPIRNEIAQYYMEKGWTYVYHATGEELGEIAETTVFILSYKPLPYQIIRNYVMTYARLNGTVMQGTVPQTTEYNLSFNDVIDNLLIKKNGSFYQGECFRKGCYISVSEHTNDVRLYEYEDEKSYILKDCGTPVLTSGFVKQKYKEVFTKADLF